MKILLAIDDSACSESAVETVIQRYRPENCAVLVLHAIDTLKLTPTPTATVLAPFMAEDYFALQDQWKKEGEALVTQTAKKLEAAGFKATSRVQEGDARKVILDLAGEWKPDFILMGSNGKRGLDRFLLGSVSSAVSRHAVCSVEIVRPPGSY